MIQEAINDLTFPTSLKQAVISLIPKPCKDSKILDNLRPITLLNNDYKTLVLANRLKIKSS